MSIHDTPVALHSIRSPETVLLSAEQEVELGKTIEAGLYAEHLLRAGTWPPDATAADLRRITEEGHRAFQRFVAANIGLARWHARRRSAAGATANLDVEDLTEEGILGVIRAVHKWDYTLGLKFSTYATKWILNFQQRAVLRASAVTCSVGDAERCRQLLSAQYQLATDLGRPPTSGELAEYTGMTRRAVEETLAMIAPARSLDEPITRGGEDARTLGDVVAGGFGVDGTRPPETPVSILLGCLSDRERMVITEIFGLRNGAAASIAEVATRHGIRVELVRRAAETALAKMRRAAGQGNAA